MEAEQLGLRRLWVLASGLPRDAAIWADDEGKQREVLVTQFERYMHALIGIQGGREVEIPAPLEFASAGEKEDDPKRPETNAAGKPITRDPKAIAAFAAQMFGGEPPPMSNRTG